ncbi:bifunctional DNA-formamidopyrimidine glycosylase/DNA-(apurinic or apyrimidinic site) lyase [Methylocella sp. CPCC 101449]|jgi:formamidopyrimidine-DNA glycosylase|uniref:bifunctional DNA-formamidopyrimidine glycosylase/DNA-(apurinic or apyrimidinic site) lyase n=1 Tax=Methylocella sp. CPCC 101449 TaxID=2987531 RepID=UPI00288D8A49|nr:bifunctional DNA-formamidopyrimidine glycosylase/DNA-(apurinic or apyrimidinic site) lyase [Methylocella sp. CPCC 101449]MDT2020381.1 bifunctional DNA-formamidopyrimidine glycosylase/DNA-(apurinic or apyrimidinic site) lyase [Methylocella sp. CPCC 101449]HEV2574679.1 bifunctional DNA-formamidopyrimidine glycosylase/DNA-(apurinic or apyrimidinic site) lyase [Beijerinckiaceae bacterium]
MPELPEVETVRRGLEPHMTGATFAAVEQRRPDLRFPFPERFVERLEGRQLVGLGRRAKYLVGDLDDGTTLVMHLGMSGSFRIEREGEEATPGVFQYDRNKAAAHDHVTFKMSNGARIIYNDPRRFGFMQLIARSELAAHPYFAEMGIEPLGNELDGAHIAAIFAGKKTPLKAALLDQRLIAGLGNIYVSEALHRSGLSPRRAAGTIAKNKGLTAGKADLLAVSIRDVLMEAVAAGGSSLRDHRQTDGTLGYFQHSFRVYDREGIPCPTPKCTGTIQRIVQSGRSTFFCGKCQK